MDQLWGQCYGFIRQQAMRWARAWESRPDFDADDLTQAGYMALCEAVRGFQKDRGGFLGFLSFHLKTEFSKVVGCRTTAQTKEPIYNSVSFETPVSSDSDGLTIEDTLGADCVELEAAEESIYQDQLSSLVREAVNQLPDRQRQAVESYYLKGRTYSEICENMNCTQSYVGELCKFGLRSMRKGKFHDRLSEMLYCDHNLYRGTGLTSFRERGSVVEMEAMRHEEQLNRIEKRETIEKKAQYAMERLGWTRERAEHVFSV